MRRVIFILAFALQGAILAANGLHPATLQYWAISVLTATASIALAWEGV